MKDQLIFDTTDAGTIADSDKVLAGIISSDGSTLITDTLVGANQGLDVYVINSALDVNLQAGDGTDITQTGGALDVNLASGSITINEEDIYVHGSAFTSGTDKGSLALVVKQSTLAADANVADGDFAALKVDADGELYVHDTDALAKLTEIDNVLDSIDSALAGTLTVQATDLDIRSLDHTSGGANDSVRLGDGTNFLTSTTVGADVGLDVNIINADISVNDAALANTALANTATSVGVAATDLLGTDLANRKYAFLYNNSNRRLFVGGSGVTTANGFPVSPGSYLELRAGASIDLHAISPVAGKEMRILELS